MADYLRTAYDARIFSYGQALRDHASLRGISHDALREQSSNVVTAELIMELDASLPTLLGGWREDGPVVIDSHAVTSEIWGLRALPYSTGEPQDAQNGSEQRGRRACPAQRAVQSKVSFGIVGVTVLVLTLSIGPSLRTAMQAGLDDPAFLFSAVRRPGAYSQPIDR